MHNYLTRELLAAIGLALAVFAGALLFGQVLKRLDWVLMRQGVSVWTVIRGLPLLLPYVLMFALPMSVLTAMMLVYGKLSADQEVTAMRAGGVSFGQLLRPAFLLAAVAALLCLCINTTLGPWSREKFRDLLLSAALRAPQEMLSAGETKTFGNLRVYVGKRKRERIENIRIFRLDEHGNVREQWRAATGTVTSDLQARKVIVELHDAKLEASEEDAAAKRRGLRSIEVGSSVFEFDVGRLVSQGGVRKGDADLTLARLLSLLGEYRRGLPQLEGGEAARVQKRIWSVLLEIQWRGAWALSCLVFALLGAPLAIQAHRRENTINAAIALGLIGLYYFISALAKQWEAQSLFIASLWVWLPNLLFAAVGAALLWKLSRA